MPYIQIKVGNEFEDLIFETIEIMRVWVDQLKRYCIFVNFHQLYKFVGGNSVGYQCFENLARREGTTDTVHAVKIYERRHLALSLQMMVRASSLTAEICS